MQNLTKTELTKQLAKAEKITQKMAKSCIESMADLIVCQLQNGGRVTLRGFGLFKLRHRCAYETNDPRTGERMSIPARNSIIFKPAADTLQRIN